MSSSMNSDIPKPKEVLQDIGRIAKDLFAESERGCVLVAAAFIDELLSALLKTHFRRDGGNAAELFEGHGPLSTFSSKIEISYQLELIDATQRSSLNMLRKIRNDYAHLHIPVDFDSDRMKAFYGTTVGPPIHQPPFWVALGIAETPKAKFIDNVISHSAALAAAINSSAKRMVDKMRALEQETEEKKHDSELLEKKLKELG